DYWDIKAVRTPHRHHHLPRFTCICQIVVDTGSNLHHVTPSAYASGGSVTYRASAALLAG
ncbi:hypothetical protein J6590_039151, partial [Homalodisca vitripennis]